MEIYETDEEQVAAIKRWWKENGTSTIIGIAAGIILIGGWNFWQNSQQEKTMQASALYQQLLGSMDSDTNESSQKISEQITQQYGATTYASYAAFLLAKTKVQEGDLDSAKSIFEKKMSVADSVELRHLA